MMNFIKNNLRYFAVLAVFLMAFFFGYSGQDFVKRDVCGDLGKPGAVAIVIPEIGAKDQRYRINNFLNTANSDYYRLTFDIKTNQNSEITVKMASASGADADIASFSVEESSDAISKEFIFKADGFYKDLIFEKKEGSVSRIYIRDISLSRLNVKSEQEARLLRQTLLGNTRIIESSVRQTKKGDKYFSQLKSGGSRVGQIFKADNEYLTGISFDLRKRGNLEEKYRLELREASEKNGMFFVGKEPLTSLEFTLGDIEGLKDGEKDPFFPLANRLEKDKFYFVGMDNSEARNNFLNYLEVKGTADKNAFSDGAAVVWRDREVKEIGDLFFTIYTAEFTGVQGERILTGVKIEDLGNGDGLYSYRANRKSTDILDLFSYDRGNVQFNNYEGIISGTPENDANYVYKFSSPFSFEKIRIVAEQMYAEWHRVIISYSFDNQIWTELPYTGKGRIDSAQKFDSIISSDGTEKELYVKVTYDEFDDKEIELFGLRSFSVIGELKTK